MTDLLDSAQTALSTNLPLSLTSFIGREREMREVSRLLSSARLLTLTGPPGCGKTRLALETGRALLERFPDGVWMVDLSQVASPDLVVQQAVQDLEIVILGDAQPKTVLIDFLRRRSLLILLDNCEHLIEAAAQLCAAVLSACPRVQILATSQMPLGIPGEQEWLIPSLPLPNPAEPRPSITELKQIDAVRLFVERAAAALSDFQLTEANADTVAHICRQLDGIPLAIELAAARVKLLSVEEISTRLDSRFELLSAPRRQVSSRHQTLQSAIDWSFHLLPAAEQTLLCRLAVFAGPFSLEAVEQVCGFDPLDPGPVTNQLGALVDRSLVVVSRQEGQETHYRLLESIRLYGLARLSAAEQAQLKDRLLAYLTAQALASFADSYGPRVVEWMDRLDASMPNIRAAVNWALTEPEPNRVRLGLTMTANLSWFFRERDHFVEAYPWLKKLLELATTNDTPDALAARANAHFWLGWLYFYQDKDETREHLKASVALWKQLGARGKRGYAYATTWTINMAIKGGDIAQVSAPLEECRAIYEEEGDSIGPLFIKLLQADLEEAKNHLALAEAGYRELLDIARRTENFFFIGVASGRLSYIFQLSHRYEEALACETENLALRKRLKSQHAVACCLSFIAEMQIALGNLAEAENLLDQSEKIYQRVGIRSGIHNIQYSRGEVALLKGDLRAAKNTFHLALRGYFQNRLYFPGIIAATLGLAAALAEEEPQRAARICGFARQVGKGQAPVMLNENANTTAHDRMNMARYLLGEAAFEQAQAEGASCAFDELFPPEGAEQPVSTVPAPAVTPRRAEQARYAGLTRREREIAARITQGKSNASIARELIISERTVTTHVTNILSKLGFSSRTQIAAWAAEKGLKKG